MRKMILGAVIMMMAAVVFISINENTKKQETEYIISDKLADNCCDIYEAALKSCDLTGLEIVEYIVNYFGSNGYAAVDSENQFDMMCADKVIRFCKKAASKEEDRVTIIVVSHMGGFIRYDMQTKAGDIDVNKTWYQYKNVYLNDANTVNYTVASWKLTDEGYFIFEGSWFSKEYYMYSLSDASEQVALRVAPLDGKCRELNRKYILPVGYEHNNMFLVNWKENDYGSLNFYDVYDVFYKSVYGQDMPYNANDDTRVRAVYQISKENFETVIMKYFDIDSAALQTKTVYFADNRTYGYSPRGFEEAEYPELPYPEVTAYEQRSDNTIVLTVNAVYPKELSSKVYSHEVVVRLLEDGSFRYVSNKIISENAYDMWWHTERLKPDLGIIPQSKDCIISDGEKSELEKQAVRAVSNVADIYNDVIIEGSSLYESNIKNFTSEKCHEVVQTLGKAGFISISENIDMENYEQVEKFYADYMAKNDTSVTIYNVSKDGFIGVITFIYRNDRVQTYYVGIGWKEGGIPKLRYTSVSDVSDITLTEKGYFIYNYNTEMEHEDSTQYIRIKPLSDKCREYTEKYISGLSYVNYNMLMTDWDKDNVEDILMPCMFEDIYRMYTGENLKVENDRISSQLYEKIMTGYFPVSKEQLRKKCGYDEKSDSYQYEMISPNPYSPFGEVVDYTLNTDKTITLFVDGVWTDYKNDCAFKNRIVVQPLDDGTFRYLSNRVEKN